MGAGGEGRKADMDYKEQIKYYRDTAKRWEQGEQLLLNGELRMQDTLREFADIIETLLAERDAAVDSIPKNCNTCCHWYDGGCVAPLELFGGCDFGIRQAWQWCGPQKGKNCNG